MSELEKTLGEKVSVEEVLQRMKLKIDQNINCGYSEKRAETYKTGDMTDYGKVIGFARGSYSPESELVLAVFLREEELTVDNGDYAIDTTKCEERG